MTELELKELSEEQDAKAADVADENTELTENTEATSEEISDTAETAETAEAIAREDPAVIFENTDTAEIEKTIDNNAETESAETAETENAAAELPAEDKKPKKAAVKKQRKSFDPAIITATVAAFVMFIGNSVTSACSVVRIWIVKSAKASARNVNRLGKLLMSGAGSVLCCSGRCAWRIFADVFGFVFKLILTFLSAVFGAIFGWITKKFKQPLYELWCFIVTPFAHAWGAAAHAHIRLKKASKKGLKHAAGSALASFWHFLGGLGEFGRFVFNYAAPVVSVIFLVSLIRYSSTLQYAITVEYNGNEIGTIENEATFNEAQAMVQDKVTFTDDTQQLIVTPKFSVTVINLDESEGTPVNDADLLSETMIETGEVSVVYAYGFYFNDELFGVYSEEDMELIRSALNAKLEKYNTPNAINVYFEDDILISEGRFIEDVLVSADGALELINGTTEVEAYYSVQRGDSISKICEKLGITRDEFSADNPDLADGIHTGDLVTYHYEEPHLNVYTTYYENYDQVIERTTEYVESTKYEEYCEILLQHGSDGYENVTAMVTLTNGEETDRNIVSRTILEEMVPRRFRVGTKENTYLGGDTKIIDKLGTFCWPLADESGYISTMPGWRSWDSSNHIALDIAGIPRGTDIYAACDGKVTSAGTHGAYGKLVIIDAGSGYECYYAHCSEIDVKEGDWVEKGDVIAHVGMTGSASGNHLHFEMHYNGGKINPLYALGGTGGHEIRQY